MKQLSIHYYVELQMSLDFSFKNSLHLNYNVIAFPFSRIRRSKLKPKIIYGMLLKMSDLSYDCAAILNFQYL